MGIEPIYITVGQEGTNYSLPISEPGRQQGGLATVRDYCLKVEAQAAGQPLVQDEGSDNLSEDGIHHPKGKPTVLWVPEIADQHSRLYAILARITDPNATKPPDNPQVINTKASITQLVYQVRDYVNAPILLVVFYRLYALLYIEPNEQQEFENELNCIAEALATGKPELLGMSLKEAIACLRLLFDQLNLG